MTYCPNCHENLTPWSDPRYGSYGKACLNCKLFWQTPDSGHTWHGTALDLAHFPTQYRHIPRYRAAVDWRDGQHQRMSASPTPPDPELVSWVGRKKH